ncbi:MAG: GNAT family N-acetyltransferase [Pseudomonadota bacterium]
MATTAADIIAAETMMASSWPALRVCLSGRWVLGMADGVTGRANSLFFLDPNDDKDLEERLDWMEAAYRRIGLKPQIRVTPLAPKTVVNEIKRRGYIFQNPTVTLKRPIQNDDEDFESLSRGLTSLDHITDEWLDVFITGSPRYADHRATLKTMLSDMLDEMAFLILSENGKPAATAMAAHHLGLVNVQNVMTLPGMRRKGFAQDLMKAVFAFAAKKNARFCWVAVEKENTAALTLYRGLGFEDFYGYIYAGLPK